MRKTFKSQCTSGTCYIYEIYFADVSERLKLLLSVVHLSEIGLEKQAILSIFSEYITKDTLKSDLVLTSKS